MLNLSKNVSIYKAGGEAPTLRPISRMAPGYDIQQCCYLRLLEETMIYSLRLLLIPALFLGDRRSNSIIVLLTVLTFGESQNVVKLFLFFSNI